MDHDVDLYRRSEFGWFLGALAVGMSLASALPVAWWAKLGLGILSALVLLPVLGWSSQPLGRVLRFLLVPVRPLPPNIDSRTTTGHLTIARDGVDTNDPEASRVVIEFAPGNVCVDSILPPGTDPIPEMRQTVKSLDVHVESVRALRGWDEVARWRPSFISKIVRAWQRSR